jgi:hypothetical protein
LVWQSEYSQVLQRPSAMTTDQTHRDPYALHQRDGTWQDHWFVIWTHSFMYTLVVFIGGVGDITHSPR